MLVRIEKLKEADNPTHPNNIEEGFVKSITVNKDSFKKPTIGDSFVLAGFRNYFVTSIVEEIISDNTFRTLNSIYKWEVVSG